MIQQFAIDVTRITRASMLITVDGVETVQAAEELALFAAGDQLFPSPDATFELTNGPTPADDFDGMLTKAVYIEAYGPSEDGQTQGWASLEVGPAFLRAITGLSKVCQEHDLSSLEMNPFRLKFGYPTWGPERNSGDSRMGQPTICISQNSFWVKSSDTTFTSEVLIDELTLRMRANSQEASLYFGNSLQLQDLRSAVEEEATRSTPSADSPN